MAKQTRIQKVIDNYKKIVVAELKRELNKPGSDLEKSIKAVKLRNRDGFGIYMNEYGINVNYGRKPGKQPPPQKIRDWVNKNKSKLRIAANASPSKINQVAFLVGQSIARRGIQPTRFIDIVIDKFEPKISNDLLDAYGKDLKDKINQATPSAKKG